MKKQRTGILFDARRLPLHVGIARAISKFKDQYRDLTPVEIHFSPSETPNDLIRISGLNVVVSESDKDISPGFIRITTLPLTEFELEMARFENQVQAKVAHLTA